MPMRAVTVRFSADVWDLVAREASAQGISAAQFVRDAALWRAATLIGRRGDEEEVADIEAIARGQLRAAAGRPPAPVPRPAVASPRPAAPAALAGDEVLAGTQRLSLLARTGLMGGVRDPALDRLGEAARRWLRTPVALVSLVDAERQVFACALGLGEPWATRRQTPLSHSFCRHAVVRRAPLVVGDARQHPDLRENPAIAELGVGAYRGSPLITEDGTVLGTLCVIDHVPRLWERDQVELLEDLAAAAVVHLERRISA
jgi:GAF domain-containing protein